MTHSRIRPTVVETSLPIFMYHGLERVTRLFHVLVSSATKVDVLFLLHRVAVKDSGKSRRMARETWHVLRNKPSLVCPHVEPTLVRPFLRDVVAFKSSL